MVSSETISGAGEARPRNPWLLRWILAGCAVPLLLGGISWLGYAVGLAFVAEALAGPAMFSAPLSPFLVKAFTASDLHGVMPWVVGVGVAAFNVTLYAALGSLHWRLRRQPPVNQALWLTLVIFIGFSVTSFVASIWAFGG
jgi:hypothetical protein